jgi:hypothetical protein
LFSVGVLASTRSKAELFREFSEGSSSFGGDGEGTWITFSPSIAQNQGESSLSIDDSEGFFEPA